MADVDGRRGPFGGPAVRPRIDTAAPLWDQRTFYGRLEREKRRKPAQEL